MVIARIPPDFSDFSHDIFPALLRVGSAVYGCPLKEYLLDIGDPAAYTQAQRDAATLRRS
ncbi:MAG: hypothetical protein MI924_38555 [Chloroflexales bacterium]|nr:hypothetical protein [Chloroflexales bacterium]